MERLGNGHMPERPIDIYTDIHEYAANMCMAKLNICTVCYIL